MPTVTAIVTIVPGVGANARRWRADFAVVRQAGSCPWVVMLGDYSGSYRGEALNRAPSAGHLVNERQGVLLQPQTGKIGNIRTSWILYWKATTHTHAQSSFGLCSISSSQWRACREDSQDK